MLYVLRFHIGRWSSHQGGSQVTYRAAKAGGFALARPSRSRGRASEQYGRVTSALTEQAPSAIGEHMPNAYNLEDFTRSRFPDRNLLSSVLNGLKTGSTSARSLELCLPPDRDRPR